jgi:hypothetical protein
LNSSTGKAQEVTGRLFGIVIFCIFLYAVLDVVAQLLPPHYSPISQAESDLAVGPYGYIMTINFVNRGLLSLLFLYGITQTVKTEPSTGRYRGGILLLGIWGVGALLLAAFPTDVPSLPISGHGLIHLVVAILAFFGGAFGTFLISSSLGRSPLLCGAKRFALSISSLALIFLFATLGSMAIVVGMGGLIERIFIGLVLLWMLTMSIYLIGRVKSH